MINRETFFTFIKSNKLYIFLILLIISLNYLSSSAALNETSGIIFEPTKTIEWQDEFPAEEKIASMIFEGNIYAVSLIVITSLLVLGFLIGFVIDIFYFSSQLRKKEIIPRLSNPISSPWNLQDVIRVIILYYSMISLVRLFFVTGSFSFFVRLFEGLPDNSLIAIDGFTNMALGFSFSYMSISIIIVYFVVHKYRKNLLTALGIKIGNVVKGIFLGAASYVSYLPILFASLLLSMGLSELFKIAPEENPLLNVFSIEGRPFLLVYFVVCICFLGPVIEEIFFRGFLYPALRNRIGISFGILISSAFFSLLHMTFVGFLPIFFLGVLLAYVYERSGSLLSSITIHIIHNASITIFLFTIKGLNA